MPDSRFKTTQITAEELSDSQVPKQWDGIDRRSMPREPRERDDDLLTKGEFEKRLSAFRHSTAEAINTRFSLLEEKIIEKLDELDKTLKSGFPHGNPDEHRRDHETEIKLKNEKAALYKQVREKVISSGVWGMLGLLAMAVWEYLKSNIHK